MTFDDDVTVSIVDGFVWRQRRVSFTVLRAVDCAVFGLSFAVTDVAALNTLT